MAEQSVYQAPAADLDTGREVTEYGGLTRLKYFLYGIGLQVIYYVLLGISGAAESGAMVAVAFLALLGGTVWLGYQRFVNIGSNGWWCLMIFVPIANIYFGLKALAFPTGYDDHKEMDTAGKVIIGLFVGMIVLGVVAAIMIPMMLSA